MHMVRVIAASVYGAGRTSRVVHLELWVALALRKTTIVASSKRATSLADSRDFAMSEIDSGALRGRRGEFPEFRPRHATKTIPALCPIH